MVDTISLSTISINTVNSNPEGVVNEAEHVGKCQSIINFLFGDEFSAKRFLCYIYGLFCICFIFGAIILIIHHPAKKQPKPIVYIPAIPEHTI